MESGLEPGERRRWNQLTAIKLALQILDRKTELSSFQRHLVRTAEVAVDGLTSDLLEQWRGEQSGEPMHPRDAVPREPASSRQPRRGPDVQAPPWRRLAVRPLTAAAALVGGVLVFLILMGAALVGQVLLVLLFLALLGVLLWWRRR